MSETRQHLTGLSPAKLRLLAKRLKKTSPERETALPEIVPAPEECYRPFPLTDVQQAYWLGRKSLFELGNVASHGYTELEFEDLDVERLTVAWRSLIDRHEMLRAIVLPDGRQQVLEEVPPYEIEVLDLRGRSAAEIEEELGKIRRRMSHQVMSAESWPLFELRVTFLDGQVKVHLSFDILIADLWSFRQLLVELRQFYANPGLELPVLDMTFRDYVNAELLLEGSERFRRSESYWRERLPTLPAAPQLPLSRDPSTLGNPRFRRRRARLMPAAWRRLKERAARIGLTPSGILMAIFSEVLAVWSKDPRFTINVTLFNRLPLHPQVNEVVGDFTSLTLLEVDGSLPGTFEERARAMQEQLWRDLEHRYFGGIRVLRELARQNGVTPPRSLMPVVFTSALFEQDREAEDREAEDGDADGPALVRDEKPGPGISQTPQVWLDHQVRDQQGTLMFNWDAVEELFPAGVLDDLFVAYCTLLERLATSEEAWKESPRGFLPQDHLTLQEQVNDTPAPLSEDLLHTLFERRAEAQPTAPAVVAEGRRLSYGELRGLARHLGHRLRGLGARPNQLVAVVMGKGWEQVAAVLGVVESGAAYLPIDPSLPEERIHHLLAHGEVEVALTQSWIDDRLAWPADLERIRVDESEPAPEEAALAPVQGVEDLAYVIFTSGSTGLPKGVMIDHRGAVNTVLDVNQRFRVSAEDRVLGLSSLSFDLSVYDVFGTLAAGGVLVLPEPGASRDPSRWAELVATEGVTLWNTVPALLEMLMEYAGGGDPVELGTLRLAMLSGDWIPLSLPERIRDLAPEAEVVSLGGATEASIWSILYPIGEVDPSWSSIPYGRAMVNQSFHVLDDALEPRPIWVPGELYIGGVGVAKGYWRDPERTAASFIEHPKNGERLYRTGDLGRFLPDGTIEFLGREDFQVKVQGHRIELGEIESNVEQHPGVRSAVVVPVGEPRAYRHLAACLVPEETPAASDGDLRELLAERLPEYMVPSVWYRLETLPLTANGKVDRAELDRLCAGAEPSADATRFVAPRTPVEEELAALWREVLKTERVGVHDTFFALGGNSLMAIQLVLRLRESLRISVPMRSLFEAPTIAELAALLARLRADAGESEKVSWIPRFEPDPEHLHDPFPMTDIQQAYWMGRGDVFELGNVASHAYSELTSRNLDLGWLTTLLRRLVDRHDMLRTVILRDGRQQILKEVPPYEIQELDLRGQDPEVVRRGLEKVREEMSHQVMAADQWPLFEVRGTHLDGGLTRLHVSVDILMADGWSSWILRRDLARLARDPESVEPLRFSFRDYVMAEASLEGSELLRRSQEYWWNRLDTLPPAPQLPLAKDPATLGQPRFQRRRGHLKATKWNRLKERARRSGLTSSGVLMAAFSEVLSLWSKEPRFTLNLTTFRRLPFHDQVDDIVGDFTSLTLLEVDTSLAGGFELRARKLQEQLWNDLEHHYTSGVRVLRERVRRQGGGHRAMMPVVFTSMIFSDSVGPEDGAEPQEDATEFGISQTPQVWLDQQAREHLGTLMFNWDAIEDLFPAGLLDDMFGAYCALLDRLATSEEAWQEPLRDLLPQSQLTLRQRVNDTAAPLSGDLLHTLFERRAEAAPEALAVVAGERRLSYGELRGLARHLGHRLRGLGARPNQLVAVVMEKVWEQVAAVLGVVESGAAYLPIDPSLPEERIHHLLAHGDVEVALTQSWVDDRLAWPADLERIRVDESEPAPEEAALAPVQGVEDLAYVIFTSGSTGLPKGVMIDHRGAVNTVLDVNQRFRVSAEDRVLGLSSLSFDLSVYDVFGTLAAGGVLVLPEPGASRDPGRWAELVATEGVTLWNTVPALLEMLVEYAAGDGRVELETLRLAMLSGDWIPLSLPERVRALAPVVEVVSLGGATEASIWSILYPIREVDPSWSSIPYGRAMVNQSFHVLDGALEPRPVWVPGELYIGGVGVAKGYWRDPERTAASFIEHPQSGERSYRTGDLGRFLPDGTIEFLGREDFQVKVQGHRIELGEIESALEQHPEVRSAVVMPVGEPRAYRHLAAYLVLAGDGARSTASSPASDTAFEPRHFPSAPVPSERLGALLAALSQIWISGRPRPKYRYPSGGDLYGVRAYLRVRPGRVAGIAGGTYYFHPAEKRLARISDSEPPPEVVPESERATFTSTAFLLFLVGDLEAVAPIYGHETAPAFLALEAGYIAQLLVSLESEHALRLCLLPGLAREPVRAAFDLEISEMVLLAVAGGNAAEPQTSLRDWTDRAPDNLRSQVVTALQQRPPVVLSDQRQSIQFKLQQRGLRDTGGLPSIDLPEIETDTALWQPRRSVRDYEKTPVPRADLERWLSCLSPAGEPLRRRHSSAANLYPLETYLWVKEGRVEDLAGGTYHYDLRGRDLARLDGELRLDATFFGEANRDLFNSAAVYLFFVARRSVVEAVWGDLGEELLRIEAGMMGQLLMTEAPGCGIGCCGIGIVAFERMRAGLGVADDAMLIHSFMAGGDPDIESISESAVTAKMTEYLGGKLPAYMVPSSFLLLDALPLSPNGKVDRKALPDPGLGIEEEIRHVEPRNAVEKAMAQAWSRLLGVEKVGIYDSFFTLGGDSVQAIQALIRFEEADWVVTPRQFFTHPTIAELAELAVAKDTAAPVEDVATPAGDWRDEVDDEEMGDILGELGLEEENDE